MKHPLNNYLSNLFYENLKIFQCEMKWTSKKSKLKKYLIDDNINKCSRLSNWSFEDIFDVFHRVKDKPCYV